MQLVRWVYSWLYVYVLPWFYKESERKQDEDRPTDKP